MSEKSTRFVMNMNSNMFTLDLLVDVTFGNEFANGGTYYHIRQTLPNDLRE